MFKQISRTVREYENQGYPIAHLYISPKYMPELKGYLLDSTDEDGNPITLFPMNGKEYQVRNPAQVSFGDVFMANGGTSNEGVYLIGPDGSEISLLKDENDFGF